jgi:hypothetical protein
MNEQEIRAVVEEINARLAKSRDMPWSGHKITSLHRLVGITEEVYEAYVAGSSLHFQRDYTGRLHMADFEIIYRRFPDEVYQPYGEDSEQEGERV